MSHARRVDPPGAEAAGREGDAARLRCPDPVARTRNAGDRLEAALGSLVRLCELS